MRLLVSLFVVLLARDASAGELRYKTISRILFQIEGGTGDRAWHIQYANTPSGINTPIIIEGPGPNAYFVTGTWLRRVDVEKGLVTGRWRVPGARVKDLKFVDGRLRIEVEEFGQGQTHRRTIEVHPDHPEFPHWMSGSFGANSSAQSEAHCCLQSTPVDRAKQWLMEAENAARRDPLNPWFRIELAHIYQALGTDRANEMFAEAAHTTSTDAIDLLQLSNRLLVDGQTELARETFERGYGQFWRQGRDPRLVMFILTRLQYGFGHANSNLASDEFIERGYRVGPWIEDAEHAWRRYADILEEKGKVEEAGLWRERAREAGENSLYPYRGNSGVLYTLTALLLSALVAAILFLAARRFAPWNLTYWSRADRIRLLSITAIGWLTIGGLGSMLGPQNRFVSADYSIGTGSFSGPVAVSYFENRLPPSPERDLLLAMAYHRDGQMDKAEALYRKLPAFAESWNNLGALLKTAGKTDEARKCFEQALTLDAAMPEAQLNLGRPSSNLWTELHQKYAGGRPMLAPPSRRNFLRAFGEPTFVQILSGAFQGPLHLNRFSPRRTGLSPLYSVAAVILGTLFLVSVVIVFLRPGKEIAPPPDGYDFVMNWLLPGVAPAWKYAGGFVLLAWTYGLWRVIIAENQNRFLLPGGTVDTGRVFGIPMDEKTFFRLQTPELPYLYAALALLFVAHAAVLWRARRRRVGEPAGR